MMKAEDIMTREVITITGFATVADAVNLMKDKGLRALIVQPRNENDPYGMITETDIVYKVVAHGRDPKQMRVYQIMTKPCVVVNPELGIEYVARLFAQTKVRRAPVIQDGLVGVISISDILRKSDFVEKPRPMFIEDRIDVAREEARAICKEQGATSPACAAAWEAVEEIQMIAADRRAKKKESSLKAFCDDNPEAEECRIYED
jgi:CBS domain-containing protein